MLIHCFFLSEMISMIVNVPVSSMYTRKETTTHMRHNIKKKARAVVVGTYEGRRSVPNLKNLVTVFLCQKYSRLNPLPHYFFKSLKKV